MGQSASVFNLEGKTVRKITLPAVFTTTYRPDVIRRTFLATSSQFYQPQGVDPLAGKKTTAEGRGPGFGMSRTPRTKGTRTPSAQRGALAPFTVGGYRTHPPRSEKIIVERINKKEHNLGISSAISATANIDLVRARGHSFPESVAFPLVVEDSIQEVKTTQDVKAILTALQVNPDLERVKDGLKIRAGRGKTRGRRYRHPVGPLLVVNEDLGLATAARNLLGVSVVPVANLSAVDLAPGGTAGRLTIWSESAIKALK